MEKVIFVSLIAQIPRSLLLLKLDTMTSSMERNILPPLGGVFTTVLHICSGEKEIYSIWNVR